MNINDLKKALHYTANTDSVFFVSGAPGMGKSESIKQYAMERAKEEGLNFYEGPENYDPKGFGFFDVRLSTMDITDLTGLPLIQKMTEGESTTQFSRSPYLAPEGKGVLFLDEIVQMKPAAQASVSQLILDRRVGTHKLADGWQIVTAGNRSEDRAAVHKMPTHIANRMTHIDLKFALDPLVQYMQQAKVHPVAIAFANWRPEVFESFNPDEEVNCTPRTFVNASKFIDAPDEIQYSLIAGTIGEGATAELIGFSKIYMNLPDFKEFVKDPEGIKIPTDASIMFATIQMLAHNVTVKTIDQIAKFIDRLKSDPERQVTFYTTAGTRDVNIVTTKPFLDFVEKNEDLIL